MAVQVDYRIAPSDQFSIYNPDTKSNKTITYFTLLAKIRGDISNFISDSNPNNIESAYYSTIGGTQTLHLVRNSGEEITASIDVSSSPASQNASTGILVGGNLTATIGGSTFSISSGTGQIVTNTAKTYGIDTEVSEVYWPAYTDITPTNIASEPFTYLYIDANGNLNQQPNPFTDDQYKNYIIIGHVCHIDLSTINLVSSDQNVAYGSGHRLLELIQTFGPIKKSGLAVGPNGVNLSINRNSGEGYIVGSNYQSDQFEPDRIELSATDPSSLCRIYRDGSGGYVFDNNSGSFYNYVDPTKYDDGTGTLDTVNNNQWTVQRLYTFPSAPDDIICYYGIQFYNSQGDALANMMYEPFTEADITLLNSVFLGYLIVRGGALDLSDLGDATFIQSGLFRGLGTGGGSTTNLRLEDLSDVTISSLSNDQFLRYNSTSGAWENETVTFGTVTNIATTAPITGGPITTTGTIGITQSGASTDGYLSSTDWNTFNNKASDAFKTIAVSGQSDVVADSATDTLTFVAGSNVTITTDDATDSITINSTGSTAGSGTTNQIAKWASSTTLGDSSISDVGTAGTKININSSGTATFDNEVYSLNSFIIQSDTFESQILMFNSSGTSAYWRVGIDSASANYLAFSTGGGAPYDNHVVISRVDNGRLGVKTAAPTKTLHVAGDAIIENDATFEESIQLEGGFRPDAKTITSSSGSSNTASAQSHIIFNEWTGGAGTGTVYLPSIYGYGTYNPVFRFLASANVSASNIIRIYPNASDIGTNINGLAYVELASAYAVVSVIGIAGQWYILDSR